MSALVGWAGPQAAGATYAGGFRDGARHGRGVYRGAREVYTGEAALVTVRSQHDHGVVTVWSRCGHGVVP